MTTEGQISCVSCGKAIDTTHVKDAVMNGRPASRAICAGCGPIYCLKCKERTDSIYAEVYTMGNGHPGSRGVCAVCGTNKNRIGGIPLPTG